MKKINTDLIITLVFAVFIYGIAFANIICKDRTFSEMENRMLAGKPAFSAERLWSGEFMSDFENYVTDQFVARDSFIKMKSAGEYIFGKKINNGVYYGKEGYLAEQMLSLNAEQLDKNINAIRKYSQVTDANVMFALIPGSVDINRDKLPSNIPDVNQKEAIGRIYGELDDTQVKCIDIYSTLRDNSDKALFYRTDHHWTSLGAYYGYRALCNEMEIEAVPLSSYYENVKANDFYGTLYSKTGAFWVKPDFISTYVDEKGIEVLKYDGNTQTLGKLYEEKMLEKKDKYSMFLGGNQPLAVISTEHVDLPKLLVIRDSYFDSLAPFLTEHFSQIHVVDFRYNRGNVEKYIKDNGIENVLIIYSLANFHEDKNIGYVLGNSLN